jgi:hypothetical protein
LTDGPEAEYVPKRIMSTRKRRCRVRVRKDAPIKQQTEERFPIRQGWIPGEDQKKESFNQVVISQGSVLPAHTYSQENCQCLGAVSGLKMS